jgi:hypothetical protein
MWAMTIGPRCPICGRTGCWREITPYHRRVVELFPFRKGRIAVVRFQCVTTGRTFSMLPYQLAPYFAYTIESMIKLLVLVWQVREEDDRGVQAALSEIQGEDVDVTPWLVACWLMSVLAGLRRAHASLARFYDLSDIDTRSRPLDEVLCYVRAFGPRGPPATGDVLRLAMERCARLSGMPLVGTPSQHRCAHAGRRAVPQVPS